MQKHLKQMIDIYGEEELETKVKFGSIVVEDDPGAPPDSKIQRYRKNTERGGVTVDITNSQRKRETCDGDKDRP